ncbi:MAG: NAD(P)/FAD-dependent oxidoreductase [Oligoflexia bacterium]|nr:NAD(P)/FAD-dependent oxidoreductase [Oligoflexia bacterium]
MSQSKKIIILGGGFGGIYTALELERRFRAEESVEITLVNQDNFLLFTPMLHEIAASDLDPTDIVNPIHKLLKKTKFFCGSVDAVDIAKKTVTVSHGAEYHSHVLSYDQLVLALGSVTHFFGLPGLAENALTMKSLGDAMHLRNQMISMLEEADFECCKSLRGKLLTFVVAGGGFAGVETVAAINDFLRGVLPFYSNLKPSDLRVILAHSGEVVLPELDSTLGRYAGTLLQERGVEIKFKSKVTSFENHSVTFSDGSACEACTVVWTAGNAPNPLLQQIQCDKDRGRIAVDENLAVRGAPGVWALGDCATIPDGNGGCYPPTAQHSIREAVTLAHNIAADMRGEKPRPFRFRTLGQLASLGHRSGVAQIFGFRFSGFWAWWLWRTVYLMKLPRFEKRFRVALNWTLDVLFAKDNVQLPVTRASVLRVPMSIKHAQGDAVS